MRVPVSVLLLCPVALGLCPSASAQSAPVSPFDTVAAILETPAVPSAGYVRFNLPRRDLTVRLNGTVLAVPMATRRVGRLRRHGAPGGGDGRSRPHRA